MRRRGLIAASVALLLWATACSGGGGKEATPTPTGTILATELPSSSPSESGAGGVWQGEVDSSTIYTIKGNPGFNCTDGWRLTFYLFVPADLGPVAGEGTGDITQKLNCTANQQFLEEITAMTYNVSGTASASQFTLTRTILAATPAGLPNTAGIISLFNTDLSGPPPKLVVPLTDATHASASSIQTENIDQFGTNDRKATSDITMSLQFRCPAPDDAPELAVKVADEDC